MFTESDIRKMIKLLFTLSTFTFPNVSHALKCVLPPMEVEMVKPQWPVHEKGGFATVGMEVYVLPKGTVKEMDVISAIPNRAFIRGAKEAVKKWQFPPSEVEVRCFLIEVEFRLDDISDNYGL